MSKVKVLSKWISGENPLSQLLMAATSLIAMWSNDREIVHERVTPPDLHLIRILPSSLLNNFNYLHKGPVSTYSHTRC
jgi:hypothetical protein